MTTHDEEERLEALRALGILDTEEESLFDDLVKLGSYITGCPISLISLIDSDRQWFKARVGVDVAQTHRDISFCGHAIHQDETFIVENALEDARFADNPLVSGNPNIRFYAGKPLITSTGHRIGTLCTIDQVPRKLSAEKIELLNCLARQVIFLIEQRKNVRVLEMTRKNSQSLFEKSPLLIASMQGPDHVFEYINAPNTKLLKGKDPVGKPFIEIQPEANRTGILQVLDNVYRSGETHKFTDARVRIGRERCHFDFVLTPRYGLNDEIDGVMGIVDDITERKRMEHALKVLNEEKEIKLRKIARLLEQVPIHIALVEGPQHHVTYANRLYREVFLENTPYDGKTVTELFPEAVRQGFLTLLDEVYTTGKSISGKEVPYELITRSGATREFYFDFLYEAITSADGHITGMLIAVADVTEQVRSRVEILKKVEELDAEKVIRERFVATLSHDLQNPLMAAKVGAERLSIKERDVATIKKISGRIINNIERAERMVHNLLDANRIKAGEGLPVKLKPCVLNEIIKETVDGLTNTRGFAINIKEPHGPVSGSFDADGIRRVVENLVGNGIKYGYADSPITITLSIQDNHARLAVHNFGSVIPKNEINTLFDTYRRLECDQHKVGWGIGLSLVKGIAQAHGGRVWVESVQNEGTTFHVELPLAERVAIGA